MPETVNLRDETTGRTFGVPADQVAAYRAQGFQPETDEERIGRVTGETFHEAHGGLGGAVVGGIAGGLSGLTLGASDVAARALGADRMLSHIEAEHQYATGAGTVGGALLPAIFSGGATAGESAGGIGARILSHSPAGLVGRGGRAIAEVGEGAGLLGKAAAGTAGAAAEGAAYGGGQYLTETALEDKPLSAEGFVAGMGHGALFAAPIGAAGTLASATLQRARALFPRAEVSAAAAAGVKEQASSSLAQAVRDGDTMAAAAERKLSDVDARAAQAQAGETVTRRVFGTADPQAIGDQVTGAVDRQQVTQALQGYQQARQQFEDWIATEADPAFAAAVGKLEANQPGLDRMLAGADRGDLETLLGQVGGAPHDAQLARAMRENLADPGAVGPGGIPVGEFEASARSRPAGASAATTGDVTLSKIPRPASDAPPPSLDLTSPFKLEDGPMRIDPERRQYFDMSVPAEPMGGGARGTPAGGVPAQEIVQRGMAERPAATASRRIEVHEVGRTQRYEARMPDGTTRAVGSEQDVQKLLEEQMPEGFRPAKVQTHQPLAIEHGLPAVAGDVAKIDENAIYIAKPSDLAKRDVWGDPLKEQNLSDVGERWKAGEKLPPIDAYVMPDGRIYIEDGNHRLQRAAQDGDRPVAIRFKDGTGYRPHGEAHEIGGRIRGEAPPPPGIPTYEHLKGKPEPVVSTVPSSLIEERGWYEMPGQGADAVKADKARAAIKEGQREPIDITVGKDGKLFVSEGRNRLNAAIEQGAPIKVRWDYGTAGGPGDVFKGGSAAAGDDLLTALSGMKSGIDKGENLVEMGAPARDAYRAAKSERTSAAAEHFRSEALARREARAQAVAEGEAPNPFHEPVSGINPAGDIDAFFRDLTAPKTRDAYVAANIGRAMREEGSHAAALAKVEREWAERSATEAWAERSAILEYDGGYSRAEAERIARDEVESVPHGPGSEPPPVWESKKNLKRTEAAKKAAAASVERLHEIHSAVASNLPQELQSAWNEEGYKFLREEASRVRGVKDRINAASKVSEAFTEKYGAASETGRGYEGDRFHRRAEIEAKHAESWASEQERKHYAAGRAEQGAGHPLDAKRIEVSGHFSIDPEVGDATMGRILAKHGLEAAEPAANAAPEVGDATMRRILSEHGLGGPTPAAAAAEPDALAARILRNAEAGGSPTAEEAIARRPKVEAPAGVPGEPPRPMTKQEIREQRDRFRGVSQEQRAAKAIMRHNGKDVDIGPSLGRAAKAIGDVEAANATLVDVLGAEAPPTAAEHAKAYRAAVGQANERAAASSAKAAADLKTKVPATEAIGGRLADVGSALEVLRAIGVHVPAISHIPVIGPVLGLFFKARAVLSILGRKGGSIGRSTEGVIAQKAAATRDRIVAATGAILEGTAKAAKDASHLAGPAVLLAGQLFPGGTKPVSDKPRDLYAARMDEIARAHSPGAIDQAIAQRYPTSDPALHDAIVAQLQRGLAFLDSKAPKQTVLPGVLPGDGTWKVSMAAIDVFGKYVHAVNDPVSVLEDLAKGHVYAEGAETLRVVYPQLYQYAQQELLRAAPEMAKTLPYSRRVMISILYGIPVDGTLAPSHAQYLQVPAPPAPAPKAPPISGPLRLGQQVMSPLDHRASGV